MALAHPLPFSSGLRGFLLKYMELFHNLKPHCWRDIRLKYHTGFLCGGPLIALFIQVPPQFEIATTMALRCTVSWLGHSRCDKSS